MELAPNCTVGEVTEWLDTEDTTNLSTFLRKRHEARFFNPIKCLQGAAGTNAGYGFSIMALCCLLAETIQCYREGMPTTSRKEWGELVRIQDNESVPVN